MKMSGPRIFLYLILALLLGLLLTMIFSVKEGFGGHSGAMSDRSDKKNVDCSKTENEDKKACLKKP